MGYRLCFGKEEKGKEKEKKGKEKKKTKKKEKKKKEKKKKGGKKKKKKGDEGNAFEETQFVRKIQEATLKYQQAWERKEEKDNFEQKHDPILIREALMPDTVEKVKKETLVALLPELV